MLKLLREHVYDERSTGKLTAKKMKPIIDMLESSQTLYLHDMSRARPKGYLKFSSVNMMTVVLFIEIKKMTFAEYETLVNGHGGQIVLKNLGMPKDSDGRYMAPSIGWISNFRNHEYILFRNELEDELQRSVLDFFRKGDEPIVTTIDSTPLEANRYSGHADFNPHYQIKMYKAHIIMMNGHPLFSSFTNGNKGDCPEYIEMLQKYDGIQLKGARILSDGSYDANEAYLETFLKTGTVMSSNIRKDAIFHKEATYDKLVSSYNKLFREPDFKPLKHVTREFMLRYLASHGYGEKVGWFIRNLDYRRGNRIHEEDALKRHVCESVHRAMKRWVNLDVRGLMEKYAEIRTSIRLFTCTLLSFVFEPYC